MSAHSRMLRWLLICSFSHAEMVYIVQLMFWGVHDSSPNACLSNISARTSYMGKMGSGCQESLGASRNPHRHLNVQQQIFLDCPYAQTTLQKSSCILSNRCWVFGQIFQSLPTSSSDHPCQRCESCCWHQPRCKHKNKMTM